MERTPQELYDEQSASADAGENEQIDHGEARTAEREAWDERVIREGIEAAVREGRSIDDRTARYIASQLHGGQASALYALASSGAVWPEVIEELGRELDEQPASVRAWNDSLAAYCALRGDRGPVDGWVERAEAGDRMELVHRITSASVCMLGDIATVSTPNTEADEPGYEVDVFPWSDSATWRPDDREDRTAAARARFDLTEDELDSLFTGEADEELGDVQGLGWFGLVRWPDRPGGLVLKIDSDGNRHTWILETEDALTARWSEIQATYEQYNAYKLATALAEETPSGLYPRIWVGSLADYKDGRLHGEWFNALLEPEELTLATLFMIRSSRVDGAEEWGIFDYDEFYGVDLGEYESLATVSKVARGLAEHGEPYGRWVEYVGSDSERIDQFEDYFRGEWSSFKAYLEDYLDGCGLLGFLEQIPEEMQPYVDIDYDGLARDWQGDFHVVGNGRGKVWIYELAT